MRRTTSLGELLCLLMLASLAASASGAPGESGKQARAVTKLRASVMGAAGGSAESETARLNATLGQPTPVGPGSIESYEVSAGFWSGVTVLTRVPDGEAPGSYRNLLFQNVPNPFNPTTTLRFETSETGRVRITIYDIRGRSVRHLVDEEAPAGRYETVWDGRDDAGRETGSGVYLYRLEAVRFHDVKKMVLIR